MRREGRAAARASPPAPPPARAAQESRPSPAEGPAAPRRYHSARALRPPVGRWRQRRRARRGALPGPASGPRPGLRPPAPGPSHDPTPACSAAPGPTRSRRPPRRIRGLYSRGAAQRGRMGRGRLPVSPRALLSLGFGGRPRGIVGGGGGPPLGRTHTHTHTLGGARTRGDRPRGRGARPAERRRRAERPGQAAAEPRPSARGPHGGKAPERANGRARTAPTSAGSMARRAALGALGAGAGARWGRVAAPCACALRCSGRVGSEGEWAGVTWRRGPWAWGPPGGAGLRRGSPGGAGLLGCGAAEVTQLVRPSGKQVGKVPF